MMGTQRRVIGVLLAGWVLGFLLLGGCGGFTGPVPTPTPVPPTPTRLEQERDALREEWRVRTRSTSGHAVLRQRGIRITSPDSNELNDNVIGYFACSDDFPVMGTESGYYYLPEDLLAADASDDPIGARINFAFSVGFGFSVCFAAEEDAMRAGYQRGPH